MISREIMERVEAIEAREAEESAEARARFRCLRVGICPYCGGSVSSPNWTDEFMCSSGCGWMGGPQWKKAGDE